MLLISDLDGTLLDSRKRIPSVALRALNSFVEAGGTFTVATGRTEDTCRIATDLLPINAPVILYNGASVMDLPARRVLWDKTLDAGVFRPLVNELISRFPDLCVQIFAYGPLILVNEHQVMDPYILRENQPYQMMPLSDTPERWIKIMLSAPKPRLSVIVDWLNGKWQKYPQVSHFFSADYYYEILPRGCCKGACAQWISEYLGVTREETAAIGDHLNDLEILSWVHHGFAPSNAHPDVKAVAWNLPLSNDESAIALAVEYLLKEMS